MVIIENIENFMEDFMKVNTYLKGFFLSFLLVCTLTHISSAMESETDAKKQLAELQQAIGIHPGAKHEDFMKHIEYLKKRTHELTEIQYFLNMHNPVAEDVTLPVVKEKCKK